MRGARGAKKAGMGLQIPVEFDWMSYLLVNHRPGLAIATSVCLILLGGEDAHMVALTHDDERYSRRDVELLACLYGHNVLISIISTTKSVATDLVALEAHYPSPAGIVLQTRHLFLVLLSYQSKLNKGANRDKR